MADEKSTSYVGYVGARISLKQFKRMLAGATPEAKKAMKFFYYSEPLKFEPEAKASKVAA